MDVQNEAARSMFVSTFLEIMSRVNTPEDLISAYASLKQLVAQVGVFSQAPKKQKPEGEESDAPARPLRVVKLNDRVILKASGQEVAAKVEFVSDDGRSLMLSFDATFFGVAGKMAVVRDESGNWTSVFGNHRVEVE